MNSPRHLHLGMAIAAMGLLSTAPARAADWNGATIGITWENPTVGTVGFDLGTVTVGAGVEADFFGVFDFDLAGTQLSIRNAMNGTTGFGVALFNGFHFSDVLLNDPDLVAVTINAATSVAGFNLSRLTSGADDIYVNLQSLPFEPGQQVVLDLQFAEASVPEASTWTAGGALALAVGGLWLRRRQA